jgi:hypothetical protein
MTIAATVVRIGTMVAERPARRVCASHIID